MLNSGLRAHVSPTCANHYFFKLVRRNPCTGTKQRPCRTCGAHDNACTIGPGAATVPPYWANALRWPGSLPQAFSLCPNRTDRPERPGRSDQVPRAPIPQYPSSPAPIYNLYYYNMIILHYYYNTTILQYYNTIIL